jgi:hypothetical protein
MTSQEQSTTTIISKSYHKQVKQAAATTKALQKANALKDDSSLFMMGSKPTELIDLSQVNCNYGLVRTMANTVMSTWAIGIGKRMRSYDISQRRSYMNSLEKVRSEYSDISFTAAQRNCVTEAIYGIVMESMNFRADDQARLMQILSLANEAMPKQGKS